MLCKACKKAFRKDLGELEEADEYCPHCDNHYVIAAKTAAPVIGVEGEDARVDNRCVARDLPPSFTKRGRSRGGAPRTRCLLRRTFAGGKDFTSRSALATALFYSGQDADKHLPNRMIRDGRTKWDPKTDFYAREYEAQASERIDPGGVAAALKERMTGQAAGTGSGAGAGNAAKLQGEIEAKLRAEGRSGVMEFDENDLDWS